MCKRVLAYGAGLLAALIFVAGCAEADDGIALRQELATHEAHGVALARDAVSALPRGQAASLVAWESLLAMQYAVGYAQAGLAADTPHASVDESEVPQGPSRQWQADLKDPDLTVKLALSALIVHHENTIALLASAPAGDFSETAQDLITSRTALILDLKNVLAQWDPTWDPQAIMQQYEPKPT